MSQALKSLIKTEAWKEMEKLFLKEIEELDKCSNIDHTASNTVVARETRARTIAAQRLRNIINKIKLGGITSAAHAPKRLI